jgi:hypothetical protein
VLQKEEDPCTHIKGKYKCPDLHIVHFNFIFSLRTSCYSHVLLPLSLGSLVKLEITLQTLVPEDKHSELQVLIMGAEAVLCRNPTGFYCYCFI